MTKFKNISPLGAIEVPALRRTFQPGETFDVSAEQAEQLRVQPAVYQEITTAKPSKNSEPISETTSAGTNGETNA